MNGEFAVWKSNEMKNREKRKINFYSAANAKWINGDSEFVTYVSHIYLDSEIPWVLCCRMILGFDSCWGNLTLEPMFFGGGGEGCAKVLVHAIDWMFMSS